MTRQEELDRLSWWELAGARIEGIPDFCGNPAIGTLHSCVRSSYTVSRRPTPRSRAPLVLCLALAAIMQPLQQLPAP